MDRREFIDWMKADFGNFFIFIETVKVSDEVAYNQCRLCGYKTIKATSHDSLAIERMDNSAINHLLTEKHIGDVPKLYNEHRSKQIAFKKGQTTLML